MIYTLIEVEDGIIQSVNTFSEHDKAVSTKLDMLRKRFQAETDGLNFEYDDEYLEDVLGDIGDGNYDVSIHETELQQEA